MRDEEGCEEDEDYGQGNGRNAVWQGRAGSCGSRLERWERKRDEWRGLCGSVYCRGEEQKDPDTIHLSVGVERSAATKFT
jgi:hypothetical protein